MFSGEKLMAKASEFLESLPESSAAALGRDAMEMARKLARSVGKAAWIAGTTFIMLGVPLIFATDREYQAMQEDELRWQAEEGMHTILGTTSLA